ncbi:plasmid recombination protein [Clostridium butyricum]|nr:plasmid recombination protein [Clostridium butyricum]AXB86047.1 hypothetical protein DRB99_14010 [Clostridium butyricum]
MSKAVIRLENVKTLREIAQRELHNTRGKRVENSDGIGKVIIEGLTGVAKEIDMLTRKMNIELRKNGKRAVRKDAVRCIEIIVSSDREFFERYNYEKYFEDCNKFLKSFWGEESIIFLKTTHLDELVQHCHFMVSPIVAGKFNYSKFINGREDLSGFQQQFEEFILSKGYDIEHRELAENSRRKHKTTREWSKDMQKAKEMVELMDNDKLIDTAINGIITEGGINELRKALKYKSDLNYELETSKEKYKNKIEALESKIRIIMTEQGYKKEFIEYEIKQIIEDYYKKNILEKNELYMEYDL